MGPRWGNMCQDEANIGHLQLGPGTLKIDGARTGQQAGIRGGQDGAKAGQDKAEVRQDGGKVQPGAKIGTRWVKLARKLRQVWSRWAKVGSRWLS